MYSPWEGRRGGRRRIQDEGKDGEEEDMGCVDGWASDGEEEDMDCVNG